MTEIRLLKPHEVDLLFRYPIGRTARLAKAGKIPYVTLPDGEIRVKESEVESLVIASRAAEGADR